MLVMLEHMFCSVSMKGQILLQLVLFCIQSQAIGVVYEKIGLLKWGWPRLQGHLTEEGLWRGPGDHTAAPHIAVPHHRLHAAPRSAHGWSGPRRYRRKNARGPMHMQEKGHLCSKVLFCSPGKTVRIFIQRSRGVARLSLLLPTLENRPVSSMMAYAAVALTMPSREAQNFNSWGCPAIYWSGPKSQKDWLLLSACCSCIWRQQGTWGISWGSMIAPSAWDHYPSLDGSKALLETGPITETVA